MALPTFSVKIFVRKILASHLLLGGIAAGLLLPVTTRAAEIENSRYRKVNAADGASGRIQLAGTVALPAGGEWQIREIEGAEPSEIYLTPQAALAVKRLGRRMLTAEKENQTQQGRWMLNSIYWASRQYAREHRGKGPKTVDQLGDDNKYLVSNWNKSPFNSRQLTAYLDGNIEGPFRFLVPRAPYKFTNNPAANTRDFAVAKAQRKVLALELRPYVDDGKHWVVYTDGTCQREEPDQRLLEKYDLKIRPVLSAGILKAEDAPEITYDINIMLDEVPQGTLELTFYNAILRESIETEWSPENAKATTTKDEKALSQSLAKSRHAAWRPLIEAGGGDILSLWLRHNQSNNQDNRRRTSAFSVLGGRAAIEETLQMQNLVAANSSGDASVAIEDIDGVEVQSHPFEKMLHGNPGGRLGLANYVPHDRFFLYVGQPRALTPLLDSGAGFVSDAGAVATGNRLDYQLVNRYLGQLGLDKNLIRTLLESDVIDEFSASASDLLFIDGTDITVVARIKQAALLSSLLGVKANQTQTRKTPRGTAFWTLKDGLLVASTARAELDAAVTLIASGGKGSLGQSAEFRYMLTKLPVEKDTQLYAYFSDPFIRRLVGPEVKLKQQRRLISKARMERATALGLFAKLQGHTAPTIKSLAEMKFIPKTWTRDLSMDDQGRVSSKQWGTLGNMRSLQEVGLSHVTESEHASYKRYVDNYSRFWRQFFDPIAIRLSKSSDDDYELTTFILPLIDSSIYEGLREFVEHSDGGSPLSVPVISPRPVLNLSVNLREEGWTEIAKEFSTFFSLYSGVSPAILDDLGKGIHLAIHDAEPVLVLGSGDVLGAFGGNAINNGATMVMAPAMLSIFTRPCTILVETQAPEQTARYLRMSAANGGGPAASPWFRSAFYQVDDLDQWVWTVDLAGFAKLRFGVKVQGDYLVIRNIPWSQDEKIDLVEIAPLNGAELVIHPGACDLQLPSLHAAAADADRRSVLSCLSRLYPILLTHPDLTIEKAIERHNDLFGFAPRPHPNDQWQWDGRSLRSRNFGIANRPRQPAYEAEKPFGLLQRIDSAKLNMQFEDDGLRSQITWKVRRPEQTEVAQPHDDATAGGK